MIFYTIVNSPLGQVTIQATDQGLTGLWFEEQTTQPNELGEERATHPVLLLTKQQLGEYFSGDRKTFDVPLAAIGTPFQNQVWKALCDVPFGQAISYQELAERIGNPKAVRAVGSANGKNPISVIVPCHRVIGKSGQLTGYAGGVERKKALLKLENMSLTTTE
ncbi:cysteine methyltransferase [Vibrio sp. 10N.286.49.C2]|uniref:methylated-DNA--[protein]-cysteine S-methyltransferase n=1 Tax=unclassified Vibrio TaxID=2614977 RepID=UPI000C82CACF|nr:MULTISPECIES: methylated-DNA--[protein]-cysteine S-methyltransferase [unclassified Vibrio]PMH26480.1 cysteine methyltransferase [Vibrio sp. 10N.286.49.C2]PMH54796.1 cysteine methyltransferase [Vibrio sp. 10N.286.49.B1]PMH83972.1 cysteine methyltransferase [Vibrio sp. 10N.286.48.B7]